MLARLGDDNAAESDPLLEGPVRMPADRFTRKEGTISLFGDFGNIRLGVLRRITNPTTQWGLAFRFDAEPLAANTAFFETLIALWIKLGE